MPDPGNFTRGRMRFYPTAVGNFTVSAGAAGWVDTDVSSKTGTDTTKIWVINIRSVAADSLGVRAHGETVEPLGPTVYTWTMLGHCDSSGHMDLYRVAGNDVYYRFVGYLQ